MLLGIVPQDEFEKMKERLLGFNIKEFYHLTSGSNIQSIQKHGLLSRCKLHDLGVGYESYSRPADTEWQRKRDNEYGGYIHLSFRPGAQLIKPKFRHETFVVVVDFGVLSHSDIKFSDKNLWCEDVKIESGLKGLNFVKLEYFNNLNHQDNRPREYFYSLQAEVLIKDNISTNDIIAIEPYQNVYKKWFDENKSLI